MIPFDFMRYFLWLIIIKTANPIKSKKCQKASRRIRHWLIDGMALACLSSTAAETVATPIRHHSLTDGIGRVF
jgi:hypothetical protein